MKRSTVIRTAIFLATVVASWAVLSLGSSQAEFSLAAGDVAQQTYSADRSDSIENVAETERLREEARNSVDKPYYTALDVQDAVYQKVREVFEGIEALELTATPSDTPVTIPTLPTTTTTTSAAGDGSTTTTEQTLPAVVTGVVFIDANDNGMFDPESEAERPDIGLANITLTVTTADDTFNVETDGQGFWTAQYAGGPAVIEVDAEDPDIPEGYHVSTDNTGQLVECGFGETCESAPVGVGIEFRPLTEIADVIRAQQQLPEQNALYLAEVATGDMVRAAFGEARLLTVMQAVATDRVSTEFGRQILPEDLSSVQASVRSSPPQVLFNDEIDVDAGEAVAEIVASRLQANRLVDVQQWESQKEEAAAEVAPVMVDIVQGETIVQEGERLTALQIAEIEATSNPTVEEQPSGGLLAVIAILVALLGLYLANFRPEFWARPRMVALLGIMIVLAASSVRGTVALEEVSLYVLPAVAFGFMTAVLFDQRIAVLMALAVGVLSAAGTLDVGVAVYGSLAALAPIPFVSSVSSRGAFRNAVVLSAVVAAAVAGATSWFFHVGPNESTYQVVGLAMAWAFGISAVAALVGLAALQFFESAFDITTTLSLLDLTDRNHEALEMLQREAFGTFNHSLMVGTLAHAAARAIGANALLARAMAYYHDLGKTQNPTFFIENQTGMNNPHDYMDPEESARIIRNHVTAGVALARDYKIPTDVTEGIVSHHGDGVMRYFYEKARQQHGDAVNIDDFRHIGHKPRTAEAAILMLSDALEAACRAVFQSEEPTPDSIEKVVDRVVNEKVEDGQLSESPLTLAQLTRIRQAFLDSLIGHYHTRIAYPNFPGS